MCLITDGTDLEKRERDRLCWRVELQKWSLRTGRWDTVSQELTYFQEINLKCKIYDLLFFKNIYTIPWELPYSEDS